MLLGQNDRQIRHPLEGFAKLANSAVAAALLNRSQTDREEKQKLFTSELANALLAQPTPGSPAIAPEPLDPHSPTQTFADLEGTPEVPAVSQQQAILAELLKGESPRTVEFGAQLGFEQAFGTQPERRIIKGIDGLNYYADTGEQVLTNQTAITPEQKAQNAALTTAATEKAKLDAQALAAANEPLKRQSFTVEDSVGNVDTIVVNSREELAALDARLNAGELKLRDTPSAPVPTKLQKFLDERDQLIGEGKQDTPRFRDIQAAIDRETAVAAAAKPEIVKLQNAIKNFVDAGLGDSPEAEQLRARIAKLVTTTGQVITINPDGTVTIAENVKGSSRATPDEAGAIKMAQLVAKSRHDSKQAGIAIGPAIARTTSLLRDIRGNPDIGGFRGTVGSVLGQFIAQVDPGLADDFVAAVNNGASRAELEGFRAAIRLAVARAIPTVSGEESGRFSDIERRITEAFFAALDPASDAQAIESALMEIQSSQILAQRLHGMKSGTIEPFSFDKVREGDQPAIDRLATLVDELKDFGLDERSIKRFLSELQGVQTSITPFLQ